jgi:hypothetical protein
MADEDKAANPATTADAPQLPPPTQDGSGKLAETGPEGVLATRDDAAEGDDKGRRSERRRARKQAQLNSTSGAVGKEGEGPQPVDGHMPARLARIRGNVKNMLNSVRDMKR